MVMSVNPETIRRALDVLRGVDPDVPAAAELRRRATELRKGAEMMLRGAERIFDESVARAEQRTAGMLCEAEPAVVGELARDSTPSARRF